MNKADTLPHTSHCAAACSAIFSGGGSRDRTLSGTAADCCDLQHTRGNIKPKHTLHFSARSATQHVTWESTVMLPSGMHQ